MQKLREMARAFIIAKRNTAKVWLPIDSGKPILIHLLEFAFENVRYTLNNDGTAAPIVKRLARALLSLARYGKQDQLPRILPKISQEMLAEMIGTTRSRVNMFMNKFKETGFRQL